MRAWRRWRRGWRRRWVWAMCHAHEHNAHASHACILSRQACGRYTSMQSGMSASSACMNTAITPVHFGRQTDRPAAMPALRANALVFSTPVLTCITRHLHTGRAPPLI
eukprot:366238-Chlamydomonas_euryale.AAC.4